MTTPITTRTPSFRNLSRLHRRLRFRQARLPPPYVAPAVSTSPVRVLENGQYISIVNLMNKGFVPQAVSINRGESVRFVNKSGNAMRIMSATEYLGLDQQQSVGMNGTFELSFPA